MDFSTFGFVRTMAFSPPVAIANPLANAAAIRECMAVAADAQVSICLFPELALTGFTCEDLFLGETLHRDTRAALGTLAAECQGPLTAIVGAPIVVADGRLFNAAFVLGDGRVLGAAPKRVLPNYGEFYDQRWFTSGVDVDLEIHDPVLGTFPLSDRLLFENRDCRFAIEICEDLWAPDPVGNRHALAGAELILNPSASNELVGKAQYRQSLVRMSSASRICGYLYASAGPTESTKDVVFGGHRLACENGALLAESDRFELAGGHLLAEFDVSTLRRDRRYNQSFAGASRPTSYQTRCVASPPALTVLERAYTRHPFVPDDAGRLEARAAEILAIQATGLARRMLSIGEPTLVLGVSGGLDSTWAFLVCLDALDRLGAPTDRLLAVTLPGPGTSIETRALADGLARATGVELREIDIGPAVELHLSDLSHSDRADVTFENAQARERTQLLFNLANKHRGIVVGTGDLSELALGWCTFNGDQMANYNVNSGVPKTLIRYLVRWYADQVATPQLGAVLREVLEIPVSPELLPREPGRMVQQTESVIGPYELHDFFLYHHVRHGWSMSKVHAIAVRTFEGFYASAEITRWLRVFCERFHRQQFKRTTLPPGPKVGTVSLSPRGDWRMPDETNIGAMLAEIDALDGSG